MVPPLHQAVGGLWQQRAAQRQDHSRDRRQAQAQPPAPLLNVLRACPSIECLPGVRQPPAVSLQGTLSIIGGSVDSNLSITLLHLLMALQYVL